MLATWIFRRGKDSITKDRNAPGPLRDLVALMVTPRLPQPGKKRYTSECGDSPNRRRAGFEHSACPDCPQTRSQRRRARQGRGVIVTERHSVASKAAWNLRKKCRGETEFIYPASPHRLTFFYTTSAGRTGWHRPVEQLIKTTSSDRGAHHR
jgi:hypothetical protein